MKSFATDMTHKYVYGILFMLLSLVLFPHTYITVVSYFFLVAMMVALAGYILDSQKVIIIANISATLLSAAIGLGILAYHWEWMFNRE